MNFEYETSPTGVWTRMQAEHDLLEQTIAANPNEGDVGYLDNRVVDEQRRIAVYYVDALGMSEGMQFALVQGRHIVGFDGECHFHRGELQVDEVRIPQALNDRRDSITQWIVDAVTEYLRSYSNSWLIRVGTEISVNCEEIFWRVMPQKTT
jgi:hypothetical protein